MSPTRAAYYHRRCGKWSHELNCAARTGRMRTSPAAPWTAGSYTCEPVQSYRTCFHWQTNDVTDAACHHADIGVVALLNGIGPGAALPGSGCQIRVHRGVAQRLHGDAADFLPSHLHIVRPTPQADAGP